MAHTDFENAISVIIDLLPLISKEKFIEDEDENTVENIRNQFDRFDDYNRSDFEQYYYYSNSQLHPKRLTFDEIIDYYFPSKKS